MEGVIHIPNVEDLLISFFVGEFDFFGYMFNIMCQNGEDTDCSAHKFDALRV